MSVIFYVSYKSLIDWLECFTPYLQYFNHITGVGPDKIGMNKKIVRSLDCIACPWLLDAPLRDTTKVTIAAMTVGKHTAHSDRVGWYTFGVEIWQDVPDAYFC